MGVVAEFNPRLALPTHWISLLLEDETLPSVSETQPCVRGLDLSVKWEGDYQLQCWRLLMTCDVGF